MEPKGRPTSGCSEHSRRPIFTVLHHDRGRMKKRDEVDQIDWWRVLASKLGFNLGGEIGDGRGYGRAAG